MKILHTIEGMSAASGGPSSCLYNLVKGLNNINGVQADILATDSPDALGRNDDFVHLVLDDRRTPLHISHAYGHWLKEHIKEYDIVHINGFWTWHSHQAVREARRAGKRVVISPHGLLYPAGLASKPWKKRLALALYQKADLKHADAFHATCEREADTIRDFGLTQPIGVVPNCIPNEAVVPIESIKENRVERETQIIGFVGRLHPVKNIDKILEAWNSLGEATKGWELHLIGSGDADYESQLRQYVSDNHLTNVVFRGFLRGAELDKAIAELSYLVLASVSENFGMVVAEALAKGVPAIVTTGAPWSELVTNKCGWWVDPTPTNLADAIHQALTIPKTERIEMGRRGQKLVGNEYSAEAVAIKMTDFYKQTKKL